MNFRELLCHNWRWKFFSLVLAAAIWFFVDASLRNEPVIRKNSIPGRAELQATFPVALLAAGQLSGGFRVEPAEVDVTVRGSFTALQEELDWRQFRAFVEVTALLTNHTGAATFERMVQFHCPPQFEITKIDPPAVLVRRVAPSVTEKLIAPSANTP